MDTRCSCCRDTQLETLDHLFTTSDLAIKVWNYVTRPLGITHNANIVQGVLDYWWQTNARNGLYILKGRRHARLNCKTNENGQTQSCFI
ncbi:hypothetical protein KY285_001614 [Solanum tuberosum]|nr:hypothetical protein KY289_001890 [Solanum tuberosum]KAH0765743.1 hypothetical protein KY285_001614 [Solanum tuberosum]